MMLNFVRPNESSYVSVLLHAVSIFNLDESKLLLSGKHLRWLLTLILQFTTTNLFHTNHTCSQRFCSAFLDALSPILSAKPNQNPLESLYVIANNFNPVGEVFNKLYCNLQALDLVKG